jgi:phage tail tape-measure protein
MALTGYAKAYSEARAAGKSDAQAHAAATQKHGTGGSGSGTTFTVFNPGEDTGTTTYKLDEPEKPPQQPEFDPTEMIKQLEAAKKAEGPVENPDLVDDSENDSEIIE